MKDATLGPRAAGRQAPSRLPSQGGTVSSSSPSSSPAPPPLISLLSSQVLSPGLAPSQKVWIWGEVRPRPWEETNTPCPSPMALTGGLLWACGQGLSPGCPGWRRGAWKDTEKGSHGPVPRQGAGGPLQVFLAGGARQVCTSACVHLVCPHRCVPAHGSPTGVPCPQFPWEEPEELAAGPARASG